MIFDQHLPLVRKEDLNVEVLEKSICVDFKAEGKEPVARCYALPYQVEPDTAAGEFKDHMLRIRVAIAEELAAGKRVDLG